MSFVYHSHLSLSNSPFITLYLLHRFIIIMYVYIVNSNRGQGLYYCKHNVVT